MPKRDQAVRQDAVDRAKKLLESGNLGRDSVRLAEAIIRRAITEGTETTGVHRETEQRRTN